MPRTPSHRHWALAAEAVTAGPQYERDIVERVAQAIADAEVRGGELYGGGTEDLAPFDHAQASR